MQVLVDLTTMFTGRSNHLAMGHLEEVCSRGNLCGAICPEGATYLG